MKIIKINKNDWADGLKKSEKSYRLMGPVEGGNRLTSEFRVLEKGEAPDLSLADALLSPKSIAFPQSESMLKYTTDETSDDCNIMKRPEKEYPPTAVIGIRPYDAAAFLILKKNFNTDEYRDPYWMDAYESCILIGLAVNEPSSTDFSTSVNSGPFAEAGLDVLLVDDREFFFAKILTDKGGAFLAAAGWDVEADFDQASKRIEEMKSAAEKKIASTISFENISNKSVMELYNADFWDDMAFSCINCGTCAYLCPTCWCFDIQDESHGTSGSRNKLWDSCMFPLFTLHGSGHNPRDKKTMRVRQRFMHKLKYYPDKYEDGLMCVGCGRCVRFCPVNIDIRKICEKMNSYEACQDQAAK